MVAPCDTKELARLAVSTTRVAVKRVAEVPWAGEVRDRHGEGRQPISRPVHADFGTGTERDSIVFGNSHARSWLTQSEIQCQPSQPSGE
jgi:hypothetical protein